MITIGNYIKPKSLEEAYEILQTKKNSTLLGGCAFIRMGSKHIGNGIDLYDLGMQNITENDKYIEIGAMTTFRDIERNENLSKHFDDIISKSVKEIVGIQLRNLVTVGATVFSKYGFSDFITGLLVLDTSLKLHGGGLVKLEDFLNEGSRRRDILEKIIIEKKQLKTSYMTMRNSKGDYAILNAAVSNDNGSFKIAVGARPGVAKLALEAMKFISENEISEATARRAGEIAAEELSFGTNSRGSREYRKEICKVLVKRGIMEVSR